MGIFYFLTHQLPVNNLVEFLCGWDVGVSQTPDSQGACLLTYPSEANKSGGNESLKTDLVP